MLRRILLEFSMLIYYNTSHYIAKVKKRLNSISVKGLTYCE